MGGVIYKMTAQCGKCNNDSFEVHENYLSNTNYRYNTVSCSNCGMPIGVFEFNHLGNQVQEVLNQLYLISQKIEQTTNTNQYSLTNKIDQLESELSDLRYQLLQK